jgi:hypothetical protein
MKDKKPVFVVEKGIPMPTRQRGYGTKNSGVKPIHPFHTMEVTDSFLIPNGQPWDGVYQAALGHGLRHGVRFERRAMDDGVRIWRTA